MNDRLYTFAGTDIPGDDDLMRCLHCGLCLPTCPTYELTGLEKHSPRGRIRLIKLISEGELGISETFRSSITFCLGCQACETACPAGVKYGDMLSQARYQIATQTRSSLFARFLRWYFFRRVFPHKSRFLRLSRLIRIIQTLKLDRIVTGRLTGKLFPEKFRDMVTVAPRISPFFGDDLIRATPMVPENRKYRVGFTPGCFMNVMFGNECLDLVSVLNKNHCEVIIPRDLSCCGSVQGHNGDLAGAREQARKTIDAFSELDVDYIVMNSAGCSAFMREYPHLLRDDPEYAGRAKTLSSKVRDFTQFLIEIHYTPPSQSIPKTVTYDEPCHLIHGYQNVRSEPRTILKSIPGLTFVELPESDWCCGSAGIYNITQYESSMKILDRKMEHIRNSGADIVVTGNPGCLAQLRYGVRRHALDVQVYHPVTLLRMAYNGTVTGLREDDTS